MKFHFISTKLKKWHFSTEKLVRKCKISKSREDLGPPAPPLRRPWLLRNYNKLQRCNAPEGKIGRRQISPSLVDLLIWSAEQTVRHAIPRASSMTEQCPERGSRDNQRTRHPLRGWRTRGWTATKKSKRVNHKPRAASSDEDAIC